MKRVEKALVDLNTPKIIEKHIPCANDAIFSVLCIKRLAQAIDGIVDLSAMKRVEKALVDLNTTNLRSNQNAIADFNSLRSRSFGRHTHTFGQIM
jgi:hypothetical protein